MRNLHRRSALTPRLIRESVENSLSLEPGALDEKRYKKALKGAIEDAKVGQSLLPTVHEKYSSNERHATVRGPPRARA